MPKKPTKMPPMAMADNTRVVKKTRPSADMMELQMRSNMPMDYMDRRYGKLPPTKSIEHFDETFLGNASVPQTGSTAFPVGPTPPSSQNKISAEYQSDGTENMRADFQTKQASAPGTPGGSKDNRPAGVQTFTDDSV